MDKLISEQEKAIKILQWLHDNTYLFRSTEEDVKFATEYAINAIKTIPSADKTCEDCIFNRGCCSCQQCSRFYTDMYTKRVSEHG